MARPRVADASDAELLALTADEPEAYGVFYDRFERQVLAFFWRATRRADIAADLTAEVFTLALAAAESYRPELGSAKAWLFGIAQHELADMWARGRVEDRARRRLGMEPLVLHDEQLERIEQLDAEAGGTVLELLADLPEDQRTAVEGRVIGEEDYDELAERLFCSQSVVRQRVSRGLRSMRTRIGESQGWEQTR